MKNPFPENQVFQKFLGLKDTFKQFTTPESLQRTKTFARIARIMQKSKDKVAFDLLGSVNFGMADENSDTDIVIHLECEHDYEADYKNSPKLRFYETLLLTSLVADVSDKKFLIQVVDCINLKRLDRAINEPGFDEDIIARFVLYRTICRGVNKKVIRPHERRIINDKELFLRIEERLTDALIEFTKTSGHSLSFQKYLNRLREKNINIPFSMVEKVMDYLNLSAD